MDPILNYSCPCCLAPSAAWEVRYSHRDREGYNCPCGASHTYWKRDGGLDTVAPKQRRSANRDYRVESEG